MTRILSRIRVIRAIRGQNFLAAWGDLDRYSSTHSLRYLGGKLETSRIHPILALNVFGIATSREVPWFRAVKNTDQVDLFV